MSNPFHIPGYEIIEKLAEGGMSTVWKARQLSLDRLVAIKTMSAAYLPDEDAWQRFRLEAKAAARLSHPGIVQVYDAGEANGCPYIVMEFVEGHPLGEILLQRGRFSEREALDIAEQAARALAYAWDKDCIIHCDIKPDNLMMAADGTVKVLDLGLARFIGLQRQKTDGDLIVGTPNYTAPEQAEGVPDLDCRVDIYSLGATLYHMVTGRLPFAGSPGSSAMDRHISEYLPDPMEIVGDLQPPIVWLIEKMMVKDRAFRPAYWSVVLDDIAEVRQGRMPRDPLPEPGQSTVARSTRRLQAAPPREPARATAPGVARAAPKKVVVVKSELASAAEVAQKQRAERPGIGLMLFETLLLLTVAVIVYIFFFSGLPLRIRLRSTEEMMQIVRSPEAPKGEVPPEKKVDTPAQPIEDEPEVVVSEPVAVEVAEEEAEGKEEEAVEQVTQEKGPWHDDVFMQGALAFNQAVAIYNEFQQSRQNRSLLPRAETLAREAANAFESCRDRAPAHVPIDEYLHNAYRLIADIRQSTLMEDANPLADRVRQEPRRESPLPAPPSSLAAPSRTEPKPGGLSLTPVWDHMTLSKGAVWEDWQRLLKQHTRAEVNTAPIPDLVIAGSITYLMPVAEAARVLGVPLGPKRILETPVFPYRSFSYYSLRGDFGGGFDRAYLVTDTANKVVAVQFFTDVASPSEWSPEAFSAAWRTYDLVLGRTKARRELQIAHRVASRGGLVVIQTELTDLEPMSRFSGRCEYRSILYLPQPIANLIRARLENAR